MADRRPPHQPPRPGERGRPWRGRPARPPGDAPEWLYGRNAIREALRGPRQPRRLWLAEGGRRSGIVGEILQLAGRRGVRAEERPSDELTKLVGSVNHQGVVLLADGYAYADLDEVIEQAGAAPLYLLLDAVQDPQNFGTLLRTAEASGVSAVIIPEHRQVAVTPAVVNASSGAVEHLAVCRVTNLTRTIERLQAAGAWVAGLDQAAEARPPWTIDLLGPLALVVGGEGEGLSRLARERCDYLLALPMAGEVASLNAAVAGSIALYEVVRQRWQAAPAAGSAPEPATTDGGEA